MLFINTFGGNIYVDQFTLPTGNPASNTYRGQGTVNDGNGFLSGGSNPNGMQVAMNNTNSLGMTDTEASGTASALHGFEPFVAYGDVGIPDARASFGIAASITRSNREVSNQWLPGLGGGFGNLGQIPDMTTIPGDQFVLVTLQILGDINGDDDVDADDTSLFVVVLIGM